MLTSLNNIKVADPIDMLQPREIFSFPIAEQATALYPRIKDFIASDEPGLYLPNTLMPLVVPTQLLLYKNGTRLTWDDLATAEEDIYNAAGKVVLTKKMLSQKGSLLTAEPSVSVVTLKIIRQYIELLVSGYCHWANSTYSTVRFERYFTDDMAAFTDDVEEILRHSCSDYYKQLIDFISNKEDDPWAIYFTRLVGSNIYLVKSIDWRVYKWTTEQYGKQNEDSFT